MQGRRIWQDPQWSSRSQHRLLSGSHCRVATSSQDLQCGVRDGSSLTGPLDTHQPVLYTHTCCPYAERALLAILEKVQTSEALRGPLAEH